MNCDFDFMNAYIRTVMKLGYTVANSEYFSKLSFFQMIILSLFEKSNVYSSTRKAEQSARTSSIVAEFNNTGNVLTMAVFISLQARYLASSFTNQDCISAL